MRRRVRLDRRDLNIELIAFPDVGQQTWLGGQTIFESGPRGLQAGRFVFLRAQTPVAGVEIERKM